MLKVDVYSSQLSNLVFIYYTNSQTVSPNG